MKKIQFAIVPLGLVILVTSLMLTGQETKQIQFKMSIKAVSIPVFALDRKGNPVPDLKKEEIEVYVNKKKVDFFLNKQSFITKNEDGSSRQVAEQIPRLIYLCFDNIFNNRQGIKRAKYIARKMVEKSNNLDQFILLEFSVSKGISMLSGPLKKSDKLLDLIDGINEKNALNPNMLFRVRERWSPEPGLFDMRDIIAGNLSVGKGGGRLPELMRAVPQMRNVTVNSYNSLIKIFSGIFERMEYFLKIVNRPKLVFLLSHGMNLEGEVFTKTVGVREEKTEKDKDVDKKKLPVMKEEKTTRVYSQLFLKYMKRIALAVNNGGSMLFTINATSSRGGAAALKCMADESGGKYYQETDVNTVVNEIHRDIAAYYEVYFQLDETFKNPISLSYKCSRRGVKIKSIRSLKKISKFGDLNTIQKKAYLLDSFLSNNWKRYFEIYKVIPFKSSLKKDCQIEVNLEGLNLVNKEIEIYLISVPKGSDKYEFKSTKKKAEKNEMINFERESDRNYFFVIVDLKNSSSYYNIL